MKKLIDLTTKAFLFVLIIYIPFSAIISELLQSKTALSENIVFWGTHWYEPVAITLLLLVILVNLIYKKLNCSWSVVLVALLLALGTVSIFVFSESISRGVEGFRFTLIGLVVFI